MPNFLQSLMGPPTPTVMPKPEVFSAAMERRAKASGFPNAAAMMAWSRQRNQQSGGTVQGKGGPVNPMVMHPKNILQRVLGAWQGATN